VQLVPCFARSGEYLLTFDYNWSPKGYIVLLFAGLRHHKIYATFFVFKKEGTMSQFQGAPSGYTIIHKDGFYYPAQVFGAYYALFYLQNRTTPARYTHHSAAVAFCVRHKNVLPMEYESRLVLDPHNFVVPLGLTS
jgi:hypothetical protein